MDSKDLIQFNNFVFPFPLVLWWILFIISHNFYFTCFSFWMVLNFPNSFIFFMVYFTLFYFSLLLVDLFYFILLHLTLFYFSMFDFALFQLILICFIFFSCLLFHSIPFYSILFHSTSPHLTSSSARP